MPDEYTDQIIVLRGHLEDFLRVLDAAYGKSAAEDLVRGYATMGSGTHRPSNLTRALEQARDRVQGYLHETDHDVEDEEA
jgi:hypothetical protein